MRASLNLWLTAATAVFSAFAGVALGKWFSRLKSPYWLIGFLVALVLVIVHALAMRVPAMMFVRPFSWMTMGIHKFALFGFIATLVLTTPLSRVPRARDRHMISVFMALMVFYICVWPFLGAIFSRPQLTGLRTKINSDGVCLQTTDYTCGPASAVTALRILRFPAEEGTLAILSCTSPQQGTPVDMLAEALQRKYGTHGLAVRCRAFKDISQLRRAGLTLAVIKYSLFQDHWVAVLDVTDSEVIIGDPASGMARLSHDQFLKKWRFVGITLSRRQPGILVSYPQTPVFFGSRLQ